MDIARTLVQKATASQAANAAPAPRPRTRHVQRLTAAAVKFESFFVAQMMKQMRQATAALADPGSAINQRVNDSTLALAEQAVADGLAGQRAFGIADVLVRQMLPAAPASTGSAAIRKLS
jgi:flagellar protein FlgJ